MQALIPLVSINQNERKCDAMETQRKGWESNGINTYAHCIHTQRQTQSKRERWSKTFHEKVYKMLNENIRTRNKKREKETMMSKRREHGRITVVTAVYWQCRDKKDMTHKQPLNHKRMSACWLCTVHTNTHTAQTLTHTTTNMCLYKILKSVCLVDGLSSQCQCRCCRCRCFPSHSHHQHRCILFWAWLCNCCRCCCSGSCHRSQLHMVFRIACTNTHTRTCVDIDGNKYNNNIKWNAPF